MYIHTHIHIIEMYVDLNLNSVSGLPGLCVNTARIRAEPDPPALLPAPFSRCCGTWS